MVFRASKTLCECGNEKSQVATKCLQCCRRLVTKKCESCGAEFQHKAGRPRKTCCSSCATALRNIGTANTQSRKVALKCEFCGIQKMVSPAYAARRFCSPRCAYDHNSGERSIAWRGGTTSERERFNSSSEWKAAVRAVWARDRGACCRCGRRHKYGEPAFDVHHISNYAQHPECRSDTENLVLLCRGCHRWVHSRGNKSCEFIRRSP